MSAQDKIARLPEAHRAGVGKASAEHGPGGVFLFHIGDEVLAFRRANSSYNHYFPGERFFQAPEFQRRIDSGPAPE